jgi:H+-translocating NAD(P) transhydrogenase subunit beta
MALALPEKTTDLSIAADAAHAVNPWVALAYLVAGVCFIIALRGLSSPSTSQRGNRFGMIGMLIAVLTTFATNVPLVRVGSLAEVFTHEPDLLAPFEILAAISVGAVVGLITARRIQMTAMPQLVAAFHSLVGLAAVLVAAAAFFNPGAFGILGLDGNILAVSRVEMALGAAIGAITFSGSVIAFAKLNGNMSGAPILLPGRHVINLGTLVAILVLTALFAISPNAGPGENPMFWVLVALAFAIGFLLIIPIGGADMPVVVSMLNSYSGWAAAAMGFTLHNTAMIITGALVGSSGAILSYIMCRAMNRSFISVIAGGFGADSSSGGEAKEQRPYKQGSAEDAAFMLQQAETVIIIPGYGMAVAQAQHALREMGDLLKKEGVSVSTQSTRLRAGCPGT